MDVQMHELAFKVLNGPVCIVGLVAYIFYAFCLFRRQDGADVPKQPLKILLGTLVMIMAILQISILFFVFMEGLINMIRGNVGLIQVFLLEYSLTSVVWLNVFYYTQIVPSHSAFSIWLKRNIKCIVYSVMISGKLYCIVDVTMIALPIFSNSNLTSANSTISVSSLTPTLAALSILRGFIGFLDLMLMMASSCATVSYLRRHLRNMKLSRSPVTSSLRNQKRVVIAGIVQIVLFFFCATWFLLQNWLATFYQGRFDDHGYIFNTVISLYTFGTAVNLGASQSVFRREIIVLGQRVSTFFNS